MGEVPLHADAVSSVAFSPNDGRLLATASWERERDFFIENLLVRIHFIIEMI